MSECRVLIVGMMDSPHLSRWLAQFVDQNITIRIFPSTPNRRVHGTLKALAASDQINAMFTFSGVLSRCSPLVYLLDFLFRGRLRSFLLSREMKFFEPDIVHGVEFQHGAYLAVGALERTYQDSRLPKFVVTNYGSDIYWYQRFPSHAQRIDRVLSRADLYLCECERDIELSRDRGYRGRAMWSGPNAGGFDFQTEPLRSISFEPDKRTLILVKGYTSFVGRAGVVLRALRHTNLPPDMRILVYSANLKARVLAFILRMQGVQIAARRKKNFSHDEMLELFTKARLYIGHSLSDGISTSFLEALASGALPIQTNTACVDEWARKGFFFESVPAMDLKLLSEAIRRSLESPGQIQMHVQRNRLLAEEHLSQKTLRESNREVYLSLLAN